MCRCSPIATQGGPDRDGFRAMLDAAGAQPGPKGLRDVALLRLLHDLGLRRSEAVRLDVEDVELQRNWIFIPGKERAPRELVSLPKPTRAALAAWLEARGSEPGPLFINSDRAGKGHRLTGAAVYHIVGWLGAKAGLTVRPHGRRHLASPPRSSEPRAIRARWRIPPPQGPAPSAATSAADQTSPAKLQALSLQNELRTANHLLTGSLAGIAVGFGGLRLAGCGINRGLRGMSDLETPEAGMMRDHSSLEAAPATFRCEELQPGLDPNNPGVAPDTALLSGSRGRETDLRGHGAAGT